MSDELSGAIAAARAYEGLHVPALFRQWAGPVLDAAGVGPGDHVLDVGCGTGVLAGEAAHRVGSTGAVTGLDIDGGMLAVAAELHPGIRWIEGAATDLPFDTNEFDAVVSQFGLMFFPDRRRAIAEMVRCTKPYGVVVVAVWDALERNRPYSTTVQLLERLAGPAAADALRAPFSLGDIADVEALVNGSSTTATTEGTARFPSVRTMVDAELRGWLPVMGVVLDEGLIEQILVDAEAVLDPYRSPDGAMVFEVAAHVTTIRVY